MHYQRTVHGIFHVKEIQHVTMFKAVKTQEVVLCSVIEHGYDAISFSNCTTKKTRLTPRSSVLQFENSMTS